VAAGRQSLSWIADEPAISQAILTGEIALVDGVVTSPGFASRALASRFLIDYVPGDNSAKGEQGMQTYAILRRNGWRTGGDLEEAAARSTAEGDQMPDDIRWIRSYVLEETDGSVGTVCIYEASSPEAIRDHASRADLPVDEIIAIGGTVVVRPDPEPAAA
jgi:hypothetical protein